MPDEESLVSALAAAALARCPAVVRVAPSPSGDPHVGTAYMALFNWLEAHSTGRRFILHIEDTGRTRYGASSDQKVMETLAWPGLGWDAGPCGTSTCCSAAARALITQHAGSHLHFSLAQHFP